MKQRIEEALFHHLLANSATPLIGSALGASLVAFSQMGSSAVTIVIAWLGLIYSTVVIRYWLTRRCRARINAVGYVRGESIRYALTTGMSGLAWGAGGLLIEGVAPLAMIITITTIQGMVMGGVLTLGAFIPSFLAFALPAMLPMIVVFTSSGGIPELVLAVYSLIFLGLTTAIAFRFNNSLRQTLQLRFEKEDLLKALTEAHDHLAVLAGTDALTGVPNRRRFDEMLASEFARLHRSRAPLSMIFLDVDYFKAYNDTYGHVEGDLCLKKIAGVLEQFLHRAPDFVARYGGEEFAGILPETNYDGAIALAEKIRAEVARIAIPHSASKAGPYVTVSLGVATLDCTQVASPAEAVDLVDRQLYRAKSEGRNRVAGFCGMVADPLINQLPD